MARRGGFSGGMPGNMNNLVKQAQKMQKQMEQMQEELEQQTIEATVGGGAVTATVSGKKELVKIKIDPEVVDEDDVEMLEDLVVAAVNEALRKADEMVNSEMSKLTGGLNLPGGLF
ncbi:MAG: YbaB/EbfC family nucleoid-associated protein [Epulopiscium sp.]|nr:YbaB/EbfC family nucleoid-associated protein [Candidatus Epulonipiscium sp.]